MRNRCNVCSNHDFISKGDQLFFLFSDSSPKNDLFSGWSWPSPIPSSLDLMVPAKGGTDYQWVALGSAYTGASLHTDPDNTDTWLTLLEGHKVLLCAQHIFL